MDAIDFKALFNNLPVPRFLVAQGEAGKFIFAQANDAAKKLLNRQNQEIAGLDISKVMDTQTRQHFEQSFAVCLSRKCAVLIKNPQNLPDGLGGGLSFWITPHWREDGALSFIDVFGQMEMREQSELQRERDDAISLLASIFDVSEVGILVTDDVGHVVRVNDSFIRAYGWSRDELMGMRYEDVFAPEDYDRARVNHKKFISVGVRSSGETKILKRDGSVAYTLYTTATLQLSQNRKFLITTMMDITHRKQMEQSIRQAKEQADAANRSKTTFLANMSHELRTPLNAILGFSELMMRGAFGEITSTRYREYLDDIHLSAQHLLEIINEVLDMSKIEAGRLELIEETFDLGQILQSIKRMLSSRVFASDIHINIIMPNVPVIMYADLKLVRQIFINLLINAIKFSRKGSQIEILGDIFPDGALEVRIIDNGIGIRQDKIRKALEPFGQVTDTADRLEIVEQGTGLGLPLAKAMMELHGGELEIQSELGKGTIVTLLFPPERIISQTVNISELA